MKKTLVALYHCILHRHTHMHTTMGGPRNARTGEGRQWRGRASRWVIQLTTDKLTPVILVTQ